MFFNCALFVSLSAVILSDRIATATYAFHSRFPSSCHHHSTRRRRHRAPQIHDHRTQFTFSTAAAEHHDCTNDSRNENNNPSRSDHRQNNTSFQDSFHEMRRRYQSRIRSLEKEVATLQKQQFTGLGMAGQMTLDLSNLDLPADCETLDVFAGRNNESHDNNENCILDHLLEQKTASSKRQFQEFQLQQVKRKIKLLEREIALLRQNNNKDKTQMKANHRARERNEQIVDRSQDNEEVGESVSTLFDETMNINANANNDNILQVTVDSSNLKGKNELVEPDLSRLGEKYDESERSNTSDECHGGNAHEADGSSVMIERKRAVFVGYRYTETEWRTLASAHPEDG
ncbi:hypothetical protein ACHAXS_002703 [Conticribra weissflogii]